MAAIDDAPAEPPVLLRVLVEMDLGRILIQPGGRHVVGLLDGHGVDMVDLLACLVVVPEMGAAGQVGVVARQVEAVGHEQFPLRDLVRQRRHHRLGRRRLQVALAHHHPADIVEHHLAALIGAHRADIDGAGLAVGVLAQADDLGHRVQAVAGIDRRAEPALGVAEIGDGVERDVRHGLAEDHVEDQQIVDRRTRIPDRLGEGVGRVNGKAHAVQRRVQGDVAGGDGARRGMDDLLADPKVFEVVAGVGLGAHG